MNFLCCKARAAMLAVVLVFLAGIGAQTASAAVVVVGTCISGVHASTIQGAINVAPANSTIKICPGTYPEQLTINKRLTLIGVASGNSDAVVIASPAAGLAANTTSFSSGNPLIAHVLVDGTSEVNLSNLIVDSAGNKISACAPDLIGIFYRNSSGTLNRVVARNQWVGASESDTNFNGCQTGLGIFAQSGNGGNSVVTVQNSSVHDYQKNGITGNELGTYISVLSNNVVGQGATNGAAENGVQIGFGAGGTVYGNTVIDDVWAPDTASDPGDAASGILLFDAASGVTVKSNSVGNTQFGIALVTDTAGQDNGERVTGNQVIGTRIFDAIDVCSNGNVIHGNTLVNAAESAIHLDASCGVLDGGTSGNNNWVDDNKISDSKVGVLKDSAVSGNSTSDNTFFTTVTTDPPGSVRNHLPYNPARP